MSRQVGCGLLPAHDPLDRLGGQDLLRLAFELDGVGVCQTLGGPLRHMSELGLHELVENFGLTFGDTLRLALGYTLDLALREQLATPSHEDRVLSNIDDDAHVL